MWFLSPWMLYGLGALGVPILIHLWHRRRVIQVPFSTLRFLKIAAARTSRSSRIENLLLLLLRCALFALLALAAARPVLSKKTAKFLGTNVSRSVVLVIDNSMSMGYRTGEQTRFEAARKEALAVLDDLKPGDEVAVIAANVRAEVLIAELTVDHAAARSALEGVRLTEAATDFSQALIAARKIAAHGTRGMREIYLFTDNQEGGWRFDPNLVFDSAWKQADPHLVIVKPDDLTAANAAVMQAGIKTPFAAAGSTVTGAATVENFSTAPLHEVLEIDLADSSVARKPIDLAANASIDVPFEFEVPDLAGRAAKGVAKIQGDNLAADDQFYFSLPLFRPPNVLIVEGQQAGPERLHSGFYLRKAMSAGRDALSGAPPRTIPAADFDDTPVDDYSVIFLAGIAGLSDRAVAKLDRYLEASGEVVFFPGDETDIGGLSRIDFLPKADGVRELPPGRLASHIDDPGNPLFANTWSGATPFPALPQRKIVDWKVDRDTRVLISFGGAIPFLLSRGSVFIVNASADRTWGDFPLSPAFLPLIQQIIRVSAERSGRRPGLTVGDPVPEGPGLPRDEALRIKYPDGSSHDLPAGERSNLVERAEESGFYEVSSTREGVLDQFAVNVDRRESNLRPIEPAALAKIVPNEILSGMDNLKIWMTASRGLFPLWPLLLLLALAAFAAEAVLANLMARDRAQGEAGRIQTGRLNKRRVGAPFRPAEPENATPGT